MKKSDNYLSLTGKYTNIRCRYLQGPSQTFHLQLHLHDLLAQYRFLESRKRCHTDEPINQVARQLDFEMVIEEGPLLHEGAVGGEFEEQGLQLTKER